MKAKSYTTAGTPRKTSVGLPASVFDGMVNESVLHQVLTAYQANQRQGTASTKTRNAVRGGNKKPWRQKGTGRARAGSLRSPLWRGGAVVFGPEPRSHSVRVPKAIRRLAIRSALNARALEGSVIVSEPFDLETPKTKTVTTFLSGLGASDDNVLILTDGAKVPVYLSARNLSSVTVKPWGEASVYDVLWSDLVVVEESALSSAADQKAEVESEVKA